MRLHRLLAVTALVLCAPPLLGQGAWRLVRTDQFRSPLFNDPGSPAWARNAGCPGERIDAAPVAPLSFRYVHVIPGSCNYGKESVSEHSHQWTQPPDVIPAGSRPLLTLRSKVARLANAQAFEETNLTAGFIPYDAEPGENGPGSTTPSGREILAATNARNGAGAGAGESASTSPDFRMPAAPFAGSDRNQGMVRLRLRLNSAKAWAAYDYVYRWEPSAAAATGATGPGSPRTGLLGGAETPCRAREATGKEWPCSVRITTVRGDGGVAGEMTWTSLGSVHRIKGTLRGSTLTFTETEAIRPGNATLGTTYTVTLTGAGGRGTYSDPVANQNGTIEIGRP